MAEQVDGDHPEAARRHRRRELVVHVAVHQQPVREHERPLALAVVGERDPVAVEAEAALGCHGGIVAGRAVGRALRLPGVEEAAAARYDRRPMIVWALAVLAILVVGAIDLAITASRGARGAGGLRFARVRLSGGASLLALFTGACWN